MVNEPSSGSLHNESSSNAAEFVLQARDIQGGINIDNKTSATRLPIPNQLPPDIRHFVDRDSEIDQLDSLMEEHLNTSALTVAVITGTAGLGKTSLAVHWAHRFRTRFPDGGLFVDLRGYAADAPVAPRRALDTFLRALDVPATKIPVDDIDALTGLYRSVLAQRRVLVVLDNAAQASQVRPLLPGTSTCLVIVTSRSKLSGLYARHGCSRIALSELPPSQAHVLFQRTVGIARTEAEPGAAAELARRCAYLPLALRIASERLSARPHSSFQDLVEELAGEHDRLDALAIDNDETTEVRTVLSWSYHALRPSTARVFRLLSLHAGHEIGSPAAAALTRLTAGEARRELDLLTSMHLLDEVGRERYRFHDLLRVYAAERAEATETADDRTSAVRRALEWYLHSAGAAQRTLYPQRHHLELPTPDSDLRPLSFASRDDALAWYDLECDNLVAAVHQAADMGFHAIAWRLPIALGSFLALRFHWADKIDVEQVGISSARIDQDHEGEFWLLGSLGETYSDLRRFEEAAPCFTESLTVARNIGNRWGEASTLHGLGLANLGLDRLREAKEYFNLASSVFRAIDDRRGEAVALEYLGDTLRREHRFDEAVDHLNRALTIHRSTGDRPREAWASRVLGLVHLGREQMENAVTALGRALAIYRELGDHNYVAQTLTDIGEAHRQAGEPDSARGAWQEAVAILDSLQSPYASHVRDRLATLDPNGADNSA